MLDRRDILRVASMLLGPRFKSVRTSPSFTIGPQTDPTKAARALQDVIKRLPRTGGATLNVPPGSYDFTQIDGTALLFDGIDQLSVNAKGARFLFRGLTIPVSARNCPNLKLNGFSIDWERPPFSQGDVISVNEDNRTIDVRLDPAFPLDGPVTVATIATYDRDTRLMSRAGVDSYGNVQSAFVTEPFVLRVVLTRPLNIREGDTLVLRHHVYGINAISLLKCDNAALSEISVYAAPGMACVASDCNGIEVDSLRVEPTPNTGRLMSTCADGVHFVGCTGPLTISNSVMFGLGDDCINIVTPYMRVEKIIDEKRVLVSGGTTFAPKRVAPPAAGHRIVFISAKTLAKLGESEVATNEPNTEGMICLEKTSPPGLELGDILFDATIGNHQVHIQGCHFEGNRARGVLVREHTNISNCRFANQTDSAVLMTQSIRWLEGGPVGDVSISGCSFVGIARRGMNGAAIQTGAEIDNKDRQVELPNAFGGMVSVTENNFDGCDGPILLLNAVRQVRFENNDIKSAFQKAIVVVDASEVIVRHNKCVPDSSIEANSAEPINLSASENQGLTVTQ